MGGPRSSDNGAMACTRCIRERSSRDLLAWSELADRVPLEHIDALRQRRLQALRHAENHLTRAGRHASLSTVLRHLEQRWARPRWVAFVMPHDTGAVIGWYVSQNHMVSAEAGAWLRHACAGAVLEVEGMVAFEVPGEFFQAAVWHLIDAHVLVVDPSVQGPAPDAPRRWEDCWGVRYTSLASVQRRRETAHEVPWPTLPPLRSASTRALHLRARRAVLREREAKARWLEARARLCERDRSAAAQRLPTQTPEQRQASRKDVDDLAFNWYTTVRRGDAREQG